MATVDVGFAVNDIFSFKDGTSGKIIEITKPLGTYSIYHVKSMFDGSVNEYAKHQLVKLESSQERESHDTFETDIESDQYLMQLLIDEKEFREIDSRSSEVSLEPNNPPPPPINTAAFPTAQPKPTRNQFLDVNDSDVDAFNKENENKNTLRKTLGHVRLVQTYLVSQNEVRDLHNIPPNELSPLLAKFIVSVKQKNGQEFQPSYMRGIIGSVERHMRRHNYGYSVLHDLQFSKMQDTLKSKQKELKKRGLGNKPLAADAISENEIEKLYDNGQLGASTPTSMINTLWLNNTVHFGMRGGGEEHRALCLGDLVLQYDGDLKLEYVQYNERQTKTRTGIDIGNIRDKPPRMYATGDDRCPVKCFKQYMEKRPPGMMDPSAPFYLSVVTNTKNPTESQQWFLSQPMGKHKLYNIMKEMVKSSELSESAKRLTNTSARKYLCQKLLANNVPDTQAVHITGHRNAQSLNNYRTLSNQQQQRMSELLSTNKSTENINNQSHTLSRVSQSVSRSVSSDSTPSLFCGATVHGGTININFHQHFHNENRTHDDASGQ